MHEEHLCCIPEVRDDVACSVLFQSLQRKSCPAGLHSCSLKQTVLCLFLITAYFSESDYAEKYLREVWPAITSALKEVGIKCVLNLVSPCTMSLTTPTTYIPILPSHFDGKVS